MYLSNSGPPAHTGLSIRLIRSSCLSLNFGRHRNGPRWNNGGHSRRFCLNDKISGQPSPLSPSNCLHISTLLPRVTSVVALGSCNRRAKAPLFHYMATDGLNASLTTFNAIVHPMRRTIAGLAQARLMALLVWPPLLRSWSARIDKRHDIFHAPKRLAQARRHGGQLELELIVPDQPSASLPPS